MKNSMLFLKILIASWIIGIIANFVGAVIKKKYDKDIDKIIHEMVESDKKRNK